jgi:ATPase subunit of ABC transporter with duplicated ATPase domains
VIRLEKISKRMGARTLFEEVTLAFQPGNRYGLTGPNGSGKSTLLRIMMGQEEASGGTVTLPKRVGWLRQNISDYRDRRVLDAVLMGNDRLWRALSEREELYSGEIDDRIGMRLAELEEIVAEEEGYTAESEAEALLTGLGIEREYHTRLLGTIPSDLQFRVLLCQALFGKPEALLLDEPTNHLDLNSISWLENFLHQFNGTLIVISHDRHFLNSVTTHIADIDYETIILYPGNYDDMVTAKTQVRARAESEAKSREKKVAQLREFVARFGAGTRASQVQSRLREIQRLQPQDLKKSNIQRPYIRFPRPEKPSGKMVLRAEDLRKSYDALEVIRSFSYEVSRGDKIGVIGNNGRGKTTLLKMLAGILAPDAGAIERGHGVVLSYFPQNHEEVVNRGEKIQAFDWLKRLKPDAYDQDIRGVMGRMLFSGDDAFKLVSNLSGGETARLILAGMMLLPCNVLILDEPNNHLDLEAVSALAWGLDEYDGTVLVASHDRDLVATVANRIIAFEPEGIQIYNGPLEEYLSKRRSP